MKKLKFTYKGSIGEQYLKTYGSSVTIDKLLIKSIIISIGVFVPVIIPLPLCLFISKLIRKNLIVRY